VRRTLGLVILVGSLAGCSSAPTDSSSLDSSAPGSAPAPAARAESFTVSQFFEVDISVFVACANGGAGETVLLSGVLHDLFHVTTNGNRFVLRFHDQPQGISGVGEISGNTYHATGVTQETVTSGVIGLADNFVNNFKIIGQRPGNNFLVHENLHVTVNANNTLTVERDHLTAECK
jgi:hypothetical protein